METQTSGCDNIVGDGTWRAEAEIGGNERALQALRELIIFPFRYPLEARTLGLKWSRGLLLYGPPGTGKTSLVRAVVQECDAHLTVLSPHSVHRAHAGESEKVLREAFAEASSHAGSDKPSVIFIDEIDVLCPRRSSRGEQGVRIASQLFTLMDSNKPSSSPPRVVVVASTNRLDAIDPALRRAGRFDTLVEVSTPNEEDRLKILQVLYVPPPDVEARLEILQVHTRNMRLGDDVDLRKMAEETELFTGAELEGLCRESGTVSLRENIAASGVFNRHFQTAKKSLKPALTVEEVETYASFRKSKSSDSRTVQVEKKKVNHSNVLGLGLSWKVGVLSLMLVAAGNFYLKQTKHGELAAAT
ncbi:hypothetical protein F2Q70_00002480 [Brassica cretica]|uniref:AAA+ ATPase domain-containing protein n=1 Tax=Brassica cretica TaxID=69181 RepID=A0A8S9ITN2_BRACR|nr:hypothetical protein F2Q70_00002480 [Brassica cretica]